MRYQKGYFDKSEKLIFVVGRDTRLSSPRIQKEVIGILRNLGIDVIDIGLVTTPMVYFACQLYNAAGLMITASHNPAPQNGFKPVLVTKEGVRNLSSEEIKDIRDIAEEIEDKKIIVFEAQRKGKYEKIDSEEFLRKYVDMIIAITFSLGPKRWMEMRDNVGIEEAIAKGKEEFGKRIKEGFSLEGLKVVIDPGNGTGGRPLQMVLEKLGIKVIGINMEPDGSFPNHIPDPTVAKNMDQAYSVLKEEKAHIAIGLDNDGDRIGAAADIDGERFDLQGDHILGSFLDYILEEFPEAVIVCDVKMGYFIKEYVENLGGRYIEEKTGHTNIKNRMRREGAIFGGEQSGHIYPGWSGKIGYFDDSIQAALLFISSLVKAKGDIKELLSKLLHGMLALI